MNYDLEPVQLPSSLQKVLVYYGVQKKVQDVQKLALFPDEKYMYAFRMLIDDMPIGLANDLARAVDYLVDMDLRDQGGKRYVLIRARAVSND